MTFPGMPSVFYGDEKGIMGVLEQDYRNPMPWDKEETDLGRFYKDVIGLRRSQELLRSGEFKVIKGDEGDHFIGFIRYTNDSEIIVLMNMSDEDRDISEEFNTEILFSQRLNGNTLQPKGFAVLKRTKD